MQTHSQLWEPEHIAMLPIYSQPTHMVTPSGHGTKVLVEWPLGGVKLSVHGYLAVLGPG